MGLEFEELLEEYTFNITEQDVFNWFKIRRRFPHEFHTQTPSVEVINSYDGESQHRGIFDIKIQSHHHLHTHLNTSSILTFFGYSLCHLFQHANHYMHVL